MGFFKVIELCRLFIKDTPISNKLPTDDISIRTPTNFSYFYRFQIFEDVYQISLHFDDLMIIDFHKDGFFTPRPISSASD